MNNAKSKIISFSNLWFFAHNIGINKTRNLKRHAPKYCVSNGCSNEQHNVGKNLQISISRNSNYKYIIVTVIILGLHSAEAYTILLRSGDIRFESRLKNIFFLLRFCSFYDT